MKTLSDVFLTIGILLMLYAVVGSMLVQIYDSVLSVIVSLICSIILILLGLLIRSDEK